MHACSAASTIATLVANHQAATSAGASGCHPVHPTLQLPSQPGCVQDCSSTHGWQHSRAEAPNSGTALAVATALMEHQILMPSFCIVPTHGSHHQTCCHLACSPCGKQVRSGRQERGRHIAMGQLLVIKLGVFHDVYSPELHGNSFVCMHDLMQVPASRT